MKGTKKELRVNKIANGSVIDHISPGKAWAVMRIMGINGRSDMVVSFLTNVPSKKHRRKDLIKIESREMTEEELNKIALVAPEASINTIKDFEIVEKRTVALPEVVKGIIKCSNPGCITNASEPAVPQFKVTCKNPVNLRCVYCERITSEEELLDQF